MASELRVRTVLVAGRSDDDDEAAGRHFGAPIQCLSDLAPSYTAAYSVNRRLLNSPSGRSDGRRRPPPYKATHCWAALFVRSTRRINASSTGGTDTVLCSVSLPYCS